jgi:hypothetical protein
MAGRLRAVSPPGPQGTFTRSPGSK